MAGQQQLRVVSVEGERETPAFITKDASLLDWAERLSTLNQQSKYHTMNYFVDTVLNQKGHRYHQIYIEQTAEQLDSMYYADYRKDELDHLAQEMIFSNQLTISTVLEDIIRERFNCKLATPETTEI